MFINIFNLPDPWKKITVEVCFPLGSISVVESDFVDIIKNNSKLKLSPKRKKIRVSDQMYTTKL